MFLLWTKGSHQSPNFGTFKYSGENLPNFSCPFSNHWSVFLQNLHNSSASLLCTFVAQIIYILFTRSQLKIFFRLFECSGQILWLRFMLLLKRQVSSSLIFISFFIVMPHNSTLNLKLIHFLLRTKGSYQSSNFNTFEYSGENLPISHVIFQATSQFSFKFCITVQYHER